MIRSYEKSHPSDILSVRASLNGRVPILAVSATLVEKDRQLYIDAGFDGWILKPINFSRLGELMKGIVDQEVRSGSVYREGQWEQGGWFHAGQESIYAASTSPEDHKKAFSGPDKQTEAKDLESERQSNINLTGDSAGPDTTNEGSRGATGRR